MDDFHRLVARRPNPSSHQDVARADRASDGETASAPACSCADQEAPQPEALRTYLGKIAASLPGTICSFRTRRDGSVAVVYAADAFAGDGCGADNGSSLLARIHPEDAPGFRASLFEATGSLGAWQHEFRFCHPSHGEIWLEARCAPERVADGDTLWHGFLYDVTDRKRSENRLREVAMLLASTREGIVVTDTSGVVRNVNPAFCRITGYSEEELEGQNIRLLQSGRHDHAFYAAMWEALRSNGFWQGEIWNRRRSGEIYPEWVTISAMRDEKGATISYIGSYSDISRLKESESRFEHLAHHDALTDLPNRLMLQARLDQAIARAKRAGRCGAVLSLDLDRFKNVNESLGHPAGDELLRQVARRLRSRLRDADTLARLGGDEFAVLLEEIAEPEDAAKVAQILIENMRESFLLYGEHEVFIGTTIGISLFPEDGETADALIQNADVALSQGKGTGKGSYSFFTADLTRAAMERLELEARLRRALERNEFLLHYQPLVTMSEGRLKGVEALVRWQDPVFGLIPPDKFIPLAEDTGLIIPLGEWVLRTACAQMKQWREEGVALESVAVNLSPKQFRQPDLHDRIRSILDEAGLPGECLELEITEGVLMEQADEVEARLHTLRELGVKVAIDDFGTGYSSLAYLKRFPIDKLKVDQSFVRDIPYDTADMEIATAIIGLAKNLGLEVLAEGVETQAQLDFLRRRGCDTGQGYFFGRPRPATELTAPACEADGNGTPVFDVSA